MIFSSCFKVKIILGFFKVKVILWLFQGQGNLKHISRSGSMSFSSFFKVKVIDKVMIKVKYIHKSQMSILSEFNTQLGREHKIHQLIAG